MWFALTQPPYGTSMPQSGAVHSIKLRRTQYEHMFSASPSAPDIARRSRHFAFGPKSDLCVDGDLGAPRRLWSRLVSSLVCSLAGVHLSVVELGHATRCRPLTRRPKGAAGGPRFT